jgi:hypothetical protein
MGYTSTSTRSELVTLEDSVFTLFGSPSHFVRQMGGPTDESPSGIYPIPIRETVTSYRSGAGQGKKALTDAQIYEQAGVGSNAILFPYDTGHDFQVEKTSVKNRFDSLHVGDIHLMDSDGTSEPDELWRGLVKLEAFAPYLDVVAGHSYMQFPNEVDLISQGTLAINATVPTKPVVSIAEFLAQLKSHQELPGVSGVTEDARNFSNRIIALLQGGTFASMAKNFLSLSGSSYLNLVFGWSPFINDVSGLMTAVINSQKLVSQILRDNGKPIRRKHRFPLTKIVTPIITNFDCNDLNGNQYLSMCAGGRIYGKFYPTGKITAEDVFTRQMWFSGEYMYHIADGDSLANRFNEYTALAQKLVGLNLTPTVLWDLAPWSWLSDWFDDLGAMISNGTLFGDPQTNLVLRYGYIMCEETLTRTVIAQGVSICKYKLPDLRTTWTRTRKRRLKATPYGFGFDLSTLSIQQLAILGALGVSSKPKKI